MRNYLYVWHNPVQRFLVASGLEFKDFLPLLRTQGGVILVDHQSETATVDPGCGFGVAKAAAIADLAAEDIYSWGNFTWADYSAGPLPSISPHEIAELLYFAHKATPLGSSALPSIKNRFLAYTHDDGWYLKLHYTSWSHAAQLLVTAVNGHVGHLDMEALRQAANAFWLKDGEAHIEEKTHNVDLILNRWL